MGDGPQTRIHRALRVAHEYGHVHGAKRKAWVVDQMVRALSGQRPGYEEPTDEYLSWVRVYEHETGCDWYGGIAP